jgi:uncharacterized protein (TIGR02453 family)
VSAAKTFSAFRPDLLTFLDELAANNNRAWFNANKERYEAVVREPCLDFIAAMAEPLGEFAPRFPPWPKKTGGSLMRVYRDTRFSRDKTPYKTNVGIQFRHEMGRDVHAPGFYFHIDRDQVFLGAGAWRPAPDALAAIRKRIDERPTDWRRARDDRDFRQHFELAGDTLKRAPRGFDRDHALMDDIRRKDFIAIAYLSHDDLHRPGLIGRVGRTYRHAAPLMRFLCAALGVPY